MPEHDAAQTCVNEWGAFASRHRGDLNEAQQDMGGLTWGLLRALAECPDCGPGVYRVALDAAWNVLYCAHCDGYWRRRPEATA